jgi:hypothetical protein
MSALPFYSLAAGLTVGFVLAALRAAIHRGSSGPPSISIGR